MCGVDCQTVRETMSAGLDGEASALEREVAGSHLAACAGCRGWLEEATAATRRLRLRRVEVAADFASMTAVVQATAALTADVWARYALAVVGIVELVRALPGLFGVGAASVHDARHIGSFGVAIAVGLLYVVWRPRRAAGVLPVVAALAGTLLFGAVVDVAVGRISALAEAHHVMELAGLLLVWVVAGRPRPSGRRRRAVAASSTERSRWRAV